MKFNTIIGNPPYQVLVGGGGSIDSAVPVYHRFVSSAKSLNPSFISFIMPSKWMVGGRGLQGFRREMCEDESLRLLVDYEDDSEVFKGIHIDGGVCYFLRDAAYKGKPEVVFHLKTGEILRNKASLKNDFFDYVIRDHRIISVLEKTSTGKSFSDIVSKRKPYGIESYLFNEPARYPDTDLSDIPFEGAVKIYGVKGIKGGARRTEGYISPQIIKGNHRGIGLYKIFFTTCYSTGATKPPEPILAKPGEICTATFLEIGPFAAEEEQKNCALYLQTAFFRFLLYYGKGTMHVTAGVFKLIPDQNFTAQSDIAWSVGIEDIDRQLYDKYNLTPEERALIGKMVRRG